MSSGSARRKSARRRISAALFGALIAVCAALGVTLSSGPPFPEVDRSRLLITLERTGCYGTCPAYRVTIDGTGNVVFTTAHIPVANQLHDQDHIDYINVVVPGTYRTRIPVADVDRLVGQFRRTNFFSLRDSYRADVTDSPTYVVSIVTGNGDKSVVDYVGDRAGMPGVVSQLQDEIDRVAGTRRWIEGTPQVLPLLDAADVEVAGPMGRRLARAAVERDDLAFLQTLYGRGVQLDADLLAVAALWQSDSVLPWLVTEVRPPDRATLLEALYRTVERRDLRSYRLLRRSFAISLSKPEATRLLIVAAQSALEPVVREMLSAGASVNEPSLPGHFEPALSAAVQGGLHDDRSVNPAERRRVVAMLLRSGANAARIDPDMGSNTLWSAGDPAVVHMLVAAGADPNRRDAEGEHVLLTIYDEASVLILLRRGARLNADERAQLMRDARQFDWPDVIEYLESY